MPEADAKKLFYCTSPDIQYLSRVIYDWLVKNDRLSSRKYLVGESYGGFRGPRDHLLFAVAAWRGSEWRRAGVALSESDGSTTTAIFLRLPWMMTLPSITAAHLERENKLTPETMADVIAYTRSEYATTLLKGRADPAAEKAMIQHVTDLTGLDPGLCEVFGRTARNGRLSARSFSRTGQARLGL